MEPRDAQLAPVGPAGAAPRRSFVGLAEVPRLLRGALAGEPGALRRILGARRGGRYGAALLACGLLGATPPGRVVPVLVLWTAAGLVAGSLRGSGYGRAPLALLRPGLWTGAGCLLLAAPLRLLIWPDSPLPAALAVLVGWLLLLRGLAGGLDGERPAQPPSGAAEAGGASPGGGPDSVEGTNGR